MERESKRVTAPSPDTRIATAPARLLVKPDPGHGSRGAPFGLCGPAIRAAASYRVAALAGPGGTLIPAFENFTPRQHEYRGTSDHGDDERSDLVRSLWTAVVVGGARWPDLSGKGRHQGITASPRHTPATARAPSYLAFVTGPNSASVLSSVMARGAVGVCCRPVTPQSTLATVRRPGVWPPAPHLAR